MFFYLLALAVSCVIVFCVYFQIKDKKEKNELKQKTIPTNSAISNPPKGNDSQKQLFSILMQKLQSNMDELIATHEYDLNGIGKALKGFFILEFSTFFKYRVIEESDVSDELAFAYALELSSMSLKDIIERNDYRFCQTEYLTENNYDEKLVDLYISLLNNRLDAGLITESDYNTCLGEILTENEIRLLNNNYADLKCESQTHLNAIPDDLLRKRLQIRFNKELFDFKDNFPTKIISLSDSFVIYGFTLSLLKSSTESLLESMNHIKRPEFEKHTEMLITFYKSILTKQFSDKIITSSELREDIETIEKYITY